MWYLCKVLPISIHANFNVRESLWQLLNILSAFTLSPDSHEISSAHSTEKWGQGLSGDFHKIAGRKIKYNEKEDKLSKNESDKTEFFVNFSAFQVRSVRQNDEIYLFGVENRLISLSKPENFTK